MSEFEANETAMWDARCNDLQNSLDRVREERDDLREANKILLLTNESNEKKLAIFQQMVDRLRVAMAQGLEL